MNEPQKRVLEELKRILPQSHFISLRVRIDGEWREFEADFLKDIIGSISLESQSKSNKGNKISGMLSEGVE